MASANVLTQTVMLTTETLKMWKSVYGKWPSAIDDGTESFEGFLPPPST